MYIWFDRLQAIAVTMTTTKTFNYIYDSGLPRARAKIAFATHECATHMPICFVVDEALGNMG